MNTPVHVVYVVGTPRSGSTLLTARLGAQPGWFAAGEVRLLWRELDTRRCGCGTLAVECPVWGRVVERVAATYGEPHHVADLMSATTSMTALPSISRAREIDDLPADVRRYAAVLRSTFRAIAEVTGARVVVDSSKAVSEASLLRLVPGLEAHLAHTVRDPRAVVHSWRRAVAAGAIGTPDRAPWSIALRWILTNTAAEVVARSYGDRATRIRYEDLTRDPAAWSRPVAELVPPLDAETSDRGWTNHIVAGNRLRQDAEVPIIEDRGWIETLERRAWWQVTALTTPGRRRYGYPREVAA